MLMFSPPEVQDPDYVVVKEAHDAFFNDVSIEDSTARIEILRPHSMWSFKSPVQSVFWESGQVSCTYLICERDQTITAAFQRAMIEKSRQDESTMDSPNMRSGT